MDTIELHAAVHGSRSDKEGRMYLIFQIAPDDRVKATAVAINTLTPLVLSVREEVGVEFP